MTDENGNAVWASPAVYDPFGELRGGGPANNGELTYTGKLEDLTGLYYFGARYYDPKIGRFITKDLWAGKIQMPQTLNDYIYVFNNPLRLVDITGSSPTCPLCKPGEGLIVPPLPIEAYLFGLLVAATITGGIVVAVWLFAEGGIAYLSCKLYILAMTASVAYDKAYTYMMIEFENPGTFTGLGEALARVYIRTRIDTQTAVAVANEFLEAYRGNPNFAKSLILDFISKTFYNYPGEIVEAISEAGVFVFEKINGKFVVVEGWIPEWIEIAPGQWGATGKWIHCTGTGCECTGSG